MAMKKKATAKTRAKPKPKAKADTNSRIRQKPDKMELPVPIPEKDIERRRRLLLAHLEEQESLAQERVSVLADLNARAKDIKQSIHETRLELQSGAELKMVPVMRIYNYDDQEYHCVRQDTQETVEQRDLTDEERQMEFPD